MANTYRINFEEKDGSWNSKLVEATKAYEAVEYVENLPHVESIHSVELVKE